MTILRQEILEAQKARADLAKWKLILVSVLGATGMGLTNSPNIPYVELVLCCIPFVCTYVDLLAYHQALVITVISEFIRSHSEPTDNQDRGMKGYEAFSWKVRNLGVNGRNVSAYDFERMVFAWSSRALSASIVVFAIVRWKLTSIPIGVAGILGISLATWTVNGYMARRDKIRDSIKE